MLLFLFLSRDNANLSRTILHSQDQSPLCPFIVVPEGQPSWLKDSREDQGSTAEFLQGPELTIDHSSVRETRSERETSSKGSKRTPLASPPLPRELPREDLLREFLRLPRRTLPSNTDTGHIPTRTLCGAPAKEGQEGKLWAKTFSSIQKVQCSSAG